MEDHRYLCAGRFALGNKSVSIHAADDALSSGPIHSLSSIGASCILQSRELTKKDTSGRFEFLLT